MAMDFNIELSDLDINKVGSWPWAAKAILIAFISCLLAFLIYWFDISHQMAALDNARNKETALRLQFETRQQQASNLKGYQEQLEKMRQALRKVLRKLPSKTEVPSLLEDISKSGLAVGLEFERFAPQKEELRDFYAELPIELTVLGNYHQLAHFVSRLVALNRIVTLHDFSIKPSKKKHRRGELEMKITAKTYRYVEPVSQSGKKGKKRKS